LAYLHGFFEFRHIFLQIVDAFLAELVGQVEQFSLEVFEVEGAVILAVISPSSPQNFSLDVEHSLQLLLDAL
jgi:hypothetical protein